MCMQYDSQPTNFHTGWLHQVRHPGAVLLAVDDPGQPIYADIDALLLYGGMHPKPTGRLHRAMAKRFPFAIYYIPKDDLVTVVAVLDCRQNPDSIVKRLLRP